MSSPHRLLLAALAGALLMTPAAPAQPPMAPPLPDGVRRVGSVEGVTEYRLANGLRILLIPDDSQPKVTVNCTVFVGSRHEGYGETGMAHLLEHMVFKGSPKFPDVPKALRDHGANFNGTTWVDRTNYFETMPATEENLAFGIELEADRLAHSFLKREELMKEFTVVRNEFEQGENSPARVLWQRMLSAAYEWHNYGKSTIGNRTDIERVPIESLRAFYKKYYRPDNAMLIVSGKFSAPKALELIARYFGPLKAPEEPVPATYTEEPPQDGERVVTLRRVGSVGAVGAVYHIPAAASPEFAACEVLNQCLVSEPNGRLYKALVETKKASSVSGVAFNWHDPAVLMALAQTEPAKTDEAREAMIATLENLKDNPITDEEVARVKRQLLQQRERTLSDSQRFAISLSDWAGAGDWRLFFLHRDRLEKVTAADVNAVAQKYLVRTNRTVGTSVPTQAPERAEVAAAPNIEELLQGYAGRAPLAAGEAFDPTPANVEARVQRGKIGGVEYAYLSKKTRGETVNLSMALRFGSPESLRGREGPAEFIGPMLLRGTKTKTRQQIKDEFDRLNAAVGVGSEAGEITVTVQTKKHTLPAVLDLLREVLREPTFPAEEFELMKREELDTLDEQKTDPQALASTALRRRLSPYPAGDVRYVPTIPENIERFRATTAAQVKELYEKQVGGVGQLAIVGDFDPAAATRPLAAALADWAPATPYVRVPHPARQPKPGTETLNTPDKANAVYLAGLPIPVGDKDPAYPALVIGNYVLGAAPLSSRLSVRVRGQEGLSYGVRSSLAGRSLDDSGSFTVFAITNPKNVGKVNAVIAEELTKFLRDGVSATELDEAKQAYIQAMRVQRGSDSALASQLAGSLYANRTFRYYAGLESAMEKLQPGDIAAAFGKYITPASLAIVEAGDFKK